MCGFGLGFRVVAAGRTRSSGRRLTVGLAVFELEPAVLPAAPLPSGATGGVLVAAVLAAASS
jgi:hypothetical protein